MNDGSLSQAEIDALLMGGDIGSPLDDDSPNNSKAISYKEIEEFQSIMNEIIPMQAKTLSKLVGDTVSMERAHVELINRDEFISQLNDKVVEVRLNYQDQISGNHSYLIDLDSAKAIASLMMGQEEIDLNDAALSAIEEAANTMAGRAITIIGNKTGKSIMVSPGNTKSLEKNKISFPSDDIVKVTYKTQIDGKKPAAFVEAFDVDLIKSILSSPESSPLSDLMDVNNNDDADFFSGISGANKNTKSGKPQNYGPQQPNVQGLQFPNLNPYAHSAEQGNIGLLMDVYMEMTVELGRTKKLIKEILGMGEGTIIELDKLAGEPVDILVNHKLIAKGEVVVIDENFGVRVTEIVSPMDRVDSM